MIQTNERLSVVDALRGYALLAIVLLHSLEHYNIYCFPDFYPDWLKMVDKGFWETLFFVFAGKAYATFSLLFGFSFYIQLRNAQARGTDFRARFAWRMFLLFLFSQLHALFYNGDILLLYSVVGLSLLAVCKLKDRTVLIIATICLLQPSELVRIVYSFINPDFISYGSYYETYSNLAYPAMTGDSFWGLLKSNIFHGQLYSNLWQIEHGRLFGTASLFMFGMLLGRQNWFVKSDRSTANWKRVCLYSIIAFVPLFVAKTYVVDFIEHKSMMAPVEILLPWLSNFAFMAFLVSGFTLLWFHKGEGYKFQRFIVPYGRMTLTNYILQSIIGVCMYYGSGLALYQYTGATLTTIIALAVFALQLIFSSLWLARHKQGPLEYLWKRGTWAFSKQK